MDPIADELNRVLGPTAAGSLLSDFGRRFYFPKGIVAQSAEAKEHANRLNATVGMATRAGQPMFLPFIGKHISGLSPAEIFTYAPTPGVAELRELWKREMVRKNPDLEGKATSSPLVVGGLTHGLMVAADLFTDAGDTVILPDLFWGNYRLIFEGRRQAELRTFPFFDLREGGSAACNFRGRINLEGFRQALEQVGTGKGIVLFNFPNNPTGYSPTREEARSLVEIVEAQARKGARLLLINDDAYFGLFYEPDIYRQSLFADFASLHENILAVKIDGSTKEDLAWGFRVGFITFASRGMDKDHYQALEQKAIGAIRSSLSSTNHLAQSLLIKALKNDDYAQEKEAAFQVLKSKYERVKDVLRGREVGLSPLPFNSGYFMSFKLDDGGSEALRRKLLMEHGIGTISIQDTYLRVAYSSVEEGDIEELYQTIYRAAGSL